MVQRLPPRGWVHPALRLGEPVEVVPVVLQQLRRSFS
jgi:hypothetical protein